VAYNEGTKPVPHYTVLVRILEVTPEHSVGQGTQVRHLPRTTEEMVSVTVRADSEAEAIERAIAQLHTVSS
jgi:hypothetical protein